MWAQTNPESIKEERKIGKHKTNLVKVSDFKF